MVLMIADSTIFGRDGRKRATKTLILRNSDTQMTCDSLVVTPCRHALMGAKTTPLSPKGWRFVTPCTFPPTCKWHVWHAHFLGCQNKQLKIIAPVASDNKDEMYIPDDPKQLGMSWYLTMITIIEGSLEVKLLLVWTDGKAEVGRVREEKPRSEKMRGEKEWEERRCRMMQVREKVGKLQFTVFFQWFVAPEGRNIGSLKRRVRSHVVRWEMKNCMPLWREAHFQVKMYKANQVRTTFGRWNVEKNARRCGGKHVSKSKCTKHTTCGRSEIVSCGRRRGFRTLSKVSKQWGFGASFTYNHQYPTLDYATLL